MRHCAHCKGKPCPCQCTFGCPAKARNKCIPVHDGVCCDSCGVENFQGNRYKCQSCQGFDLCQGCYSVGVHDGNHPFFLFGRIGEQSIMLRPQSETTEVARPPSSEEMYVPSSIHQPATASPSSTSYVVCPPCTPQEKSPIHSNAFCDGPNCKAKGCIVGPRYTCTDCPPSVDLCQDCYKSEAAHDASHSFKRYDNPVTASAYAYVVCPSQQKSPIHPNTFCDGPNCKAKKCIVGPRYTCADCPPSVDLCQKCYKSQVAHDASHVFKRFDKPVTASA